LYYIEAIEENKGKPMRDDIATRASAGYEPSPGIVRALTLLIGLALLTGGTPSLAQQKFESPPTFRASEFLPAELLAGPNHRTDERVINDGFMNIYTVNSRFGAFTAKSDEELRIRIDEVNGIARMEDWSESEQFLKGITKAGRDVLESSTRLVTDPFGTFKGTTSGVIEIFASVRSSLSDDDLGAEDIDIEETVVDLVGYSRAKRQYAAAFGVDPYSTNPVVQEYLNYLSRIGFVGQTGGRAARSFVDGGFGTAISIASYLHSLEEQVRDNTPAELREINEQKLRAMDVEESIIDLYLANYIFTPTYQTAFVDILEKIDDAAGRGEFVKVAVLAKNEDQALFRIAQARMYANHHKSIERIQKFVLVSEMIVVAARTAKGALVVNVPADYVSFTENLAAYFTAARSGLDQVPGITEKQLWLAGGLSPVARKWIEESGWTVRTDTRNSPRSGRPPDN
jgi:hypothetical protein